jgi:hypothetical protein
MKRLLNPLIAIMIIGIVAFNTSFVAKNISDLKNINLDKILTSANADMEDITITCSSGSDGQCFDESWRWCQNNNIIDFYCAYTGFQSDICYDEIVSVHNCFIP